MEEIWKKIENYENYYEISNKGRLRSKDRYVKNANGYRITKGKIIKPVICKNGYYEYQLRKEGKRKNFLAHRLVAKTFIPNIENKPEVNHKDENIKNNDVDNLEWVTSKENANYGTRNKRCYHKEQRKAVVQCEKNGTKIKEYYSLGNAARQIKGDISAIIRVCKGKQKTAYGYVWRYK